MRFNFQMVHFSIFDTGVPKGHFQDCNHQRKSRNASPARFNLRTAKKSTLAFPFVVSPTSLLLLFLFPLSCGLFAQNEVPKDIPLTGKVLSYEIFKVYGDSLNAKESLLEKATYDKNGRILEIKNGGVNTWESSSIKKHIYTSGKEIIYECRCKDIEPFINEFVIHDRNELKNQPRYVTNQEPTNWVTKFLVGAEIRQRLVLQLQQHQREELDHSLINGIQESEYSLHQREQQFLQVGL